MPQNALPHQELRSRAAISIAGEHLNLYNLRELRRDSEENMVEPAQIRNQEDFTRTLRQMVSDTGKSPEVLAARVGLSGNTVRGVAAGKTWPQRRTLEHLVRACGGDVRAWVRAWEPLNEGRDRPERADGKHLQEQVDALRADVHRLSTQVQRLHDSMDQGDLRTSRREQRVQDAYLSFLTRMPTADFQRGAPVKKDDDLLSRASPTIMLAEASYRTVDVEELLRAIQELSTINGLPELALFLASSLPLKESTSVPAHVNSDFGWVKRDIDSYLAELRRSVRQYLTECTEGPNRNARPQTARE
ncbi:helix-turn-helix domain-containing protein [Streptomyces albidoflavus]